MKSKLCMVDSQSRNKEKSYTQLKPHKIHSNKKPELIRLQSKDYLGSVVKEAR